MTRRAASGAPGIAVRTRRAYFDCRFGQLHVRTAFPTTGGFDEGVPLICLHPSGSNSRAFAAFLPKMGVDRSIYAPDLPGSGESDSPSRRTPAEMALAIADLAADLRLREIDLLALRDGHHVALELTAARPQLIRRVVVLGGPEDASSGTGLPKAAMRILELPGSAVALLDTDPASLAVEIGDFLEAKPRVGTP